MAQIILDLSGQSGLSSNFAGDEDTIVPRPERRLAGGANELAEGMFNPYFRKGYLTPALTSKEQMTTFPALSSGNLRSVELDKSNNEVFWADSVKSVYKQTNTGSKVLTSYSSFDISGSGGWQQLDDLQMYELNGEKVLYVSGSGGALATGPAVNVVFYPTVSVQPLITINLTIKPFSTTKPTVTSTTRIYNASNLTTSSGSVTVTSGTNTRIVAVLLHGSGAPPTSVTFGGVAMVQEYTGTTAGLGISVYRLAGSYTGTFTFTATYAVANEHRTSYVMSIDDAADDIDVEDSTQSNNISSPVNLNLLSTNNLNLFLVNNLESTAAYSLESSDFSTLSTGTGGFGVATARNGIVRYDREIPEKMLQVSILDSSDLSNLEKKSWLLSLAQGGFLEEVKQTVFMRTADNGFMYVFHDNKVHAVDGSLVGGENGSITKNVLLFPEYFTITDAVDYRSRLFIGIHQNSVDVSDTTLNTFSGSCGIYIWDRISNQLSTGDYVQLYGVREIKKMYPSSDGIIKLIVIADNGLVEVREFGYNDSGGVVFRVVKTLGQGAFPQFPDGLSNVSDKVAWVGNDGFIYLEKQNTICKIHELKTQGTTADDKVNNIYSGAILYGYTSDLEGAPQRTNKQALTISYRDPDDGVAPHKMVRLFPFDRTNSLGIQNIGQGDVYTEVNYIPIGSNTSSVRIYNLPISGTGEDIIATVKIYFNQSTSAAYPSGMTKSITKNEAKRGYVDLKINSQNVHSIQVEIEWNSSLPFNDDTYHPSVALIEYQPTSKRSPDNE